MSVRKLFQVSRDQLVIREYQTSDSGDSSNTVSLVNQTAFLGVALID